MLGHWQGWDKPFTCQTKGKTVALATPVTERTDDLREAYAQGYLTALELAIGKAQTVSTAESVEDSLNNIREGFLAARGEK